jgi:hypothetical protein
MSDGASAAPAVGMRPGLALARACAAALLVLGSVAAINVAAPQLATSDLRSSAQP